MTRLINVFIFLSLPFGIIKGAYAQLKVPADQITGSYQGPDKDRTMEIYQNNDQYFGKITEVAQNNDGLVKGMLVLKNLVYHDGKWTGKVYVPSRKSEYDVTVTLPDNNTLLIKVTVGIFSKTKIWTRVTKG